MLLALSILFTIGAGIFAARMTTRMFGMLDELSAQDAADDAEEDKETERITLMVHARLKEGVTPVDMNEARAAAVRQAKYAQDGVAYGAQLEALRLQHLAMVQR